MHVASPPFTVSNIKFHFKTYENFKIPLHMQKNTKKYGNFVVVRDIFNNNNNNNDDEYCCGEHAKTVLIIFEKSGTISCTGVKSFSALATFLTRFNDIFHTHVCEDDVVIDNATASGNLIDQQQSSLTSKKSVGKHRRLNLITLKRFIDDLNSDKNNPETRIRVSLFPRGFPVAVIRNLSAFTKATVSLFASGKFVIVGGCSKSEIATLYKELCVLTNLSMFSTITPATKFARNAEP